MIVFSHSRRSSEHVRAEEELWSTRLEKRHINARAGFKLYNQGKGLSTSYRMCIKGKFDSFPWEVVQRLLALPWRMRVWEQHLTAEATIKGKVVSSKMWYSPSSVYVGVFFPPFTGTFSFQNETLSYVSPPRKCAPLSISNTNLYSQCVWPSLGKTFENNTSCYERQSLFVHSGCSLWPLFIFESSRHEEKSSHFWRLL